MKNTILLALLSLNLISLESYSQIGCTKQEILNSDSIFSECEDFGNSIYTKLNGEVCMFNFENSICTSVTVIQNTGSDFYLDLIQIFSHCDYLSWSSSLRYLTNDTIVCKLFKND